MILDGKLKRAALLAAVDFSLNKVKHSPKRCARNLIELGTSAYPSKLSDSEKSDLYQMLLVYFESDDIVAAKELFVSRFLN